MDAVLETPSPAAQEQTDTQRGRAVLELRNVTLTGRLNDVPVETLRDITLSIERGEVLGLVGESGAGKSMLARLIAGLLPERFSVTAGDLRFNDRDLLVASARERREMLGREIAFIPQEPLTALNPLQTIGEVFNEHLARLGVPARDRRRYAREHLDAVHLPVPDQMLDRYPHQLSGGQCQRVLIALAFSSEPALIIADEPTTALDVITQTHVMRLLAEQQRLHRSAVLLITHDLRLAAHVCDRIAVLYAGDVVEYGPASAVLSAPRHPYTRALKDATPSLRGPLIKLPTLTQQMPGLSALPELGRCRFAPRCESRNAACERQVDYRVGADEHRVACSAACEGATRMRVVDPVPVLNQPVTTGVPVAELRDVSLQYVSREGLFGQRRKTFDAVSELSLKIWPGEFVGIVGESGSGKTSVARMLMGIETPTKGQVLINGQEFTHDDPAFLRSAREQVQLIFQDPQSALNPRRTVERLLLQALEARADAPVGERRQAMAESARRDVGLPQDSLKRFPSQLSGGQKQRVNIGRALMAAPKLLVADEIVSGLDVSVQAQILNLLLRLGAEHGIALLLISHDLSVVRYLCQRVLIMKGGRVVETGLTQDVFSAPKHPYTRSLIEAVPADDVRFSWPPAAANIASAE